MSSPLENFESMDKATELIEQNLETIKEES